MGQIVYTGGTFDLFHSGHVNFLGECRKIAGEGGGEFRRISPSTFSIK